MQRGFLLKASRWPRWTRSGWSKGPAFADEHAMTTSRCRRSLVVVALLGAASSPRHDPRVPTVRLIWSLGSRPAPADGLLAHAVGHQSPVRQIRAENGS